MLCALILDVSGGTFSLMSFPYDRFSRNFFMAVLNYSQSFCQKSSGGKSPKKYFFFIFRQNDIMMAELGYGPGLYV